MATSVSSGLTSSRRKFVSLPFSICSFASELPAAAAGRTVLRVMVRLTVDQLFAIANTLSVNGACNTYAMIEARVHEELFFPLKMAAVSRLSSALPQL